MLLLQFLAFVTNPVLPQFINSTQPDATLWVAPPASEGNTSWAINIMVGDFTIVSKPPEPGHTPISYYFFNTTLWCAADYAEAEPLVARAFVNGFSTPMVSFGPGPEAVGLTAEGPAAGPVAGEAPAAADPDRAVVRSTEAEMSAVPVSTSAPGEGDKDDPEPWLVALIAILSARACPPDRTDGSLCACMQNFSVRARDLM